MEFGLQISNVEWQQLRDTAQEAEGLGFQTLLVPDHIVAEGPERQFDPHFLSYDVMIQVAQLAEATKKARVGHLVLCNLFRHPVMTAQSLTSLDRLSNGRLIAGLGTGWTEREFKMTGIAFPDIGTRLRMLDEALTCIRSLWTNEHTTVAGEFYQFNESILWPKPVQQPHPPILLGGGGKGLVKFLREEASRHGRDGSKIRISNVIFSVIVTSSPEETQTTAEGMAPMFNTTPEGLLHSPLSLIGTPEQCIAELKRRQRDWDVSQVIFSGGAPIRRLAEEVLPHV